MSAGSASTPITAGSLSQFLNEYKSQSMVVRDKHPIHYRMPGIYRKLVQSGQQTAYDFITSQNIPQGLAEDLIKQFAPRFAE